MEKPKLFFGLKKSKIDHNEKILSFTFQKVDMPLKFSLKNNVKQINNISRSEWRRIGYEWR